MRLRDSAEVLCLVTESRNPINMKTVVFVKTILTLDDIVPLLYQLRTQSLVEPPLVIAWDAQSLKYLNKNVVLMKAIHEMGGEICGINVFRNRWLSQIHNLWVLRKLLISRHLIVETYPVGNKITRLLTWLNRGLLGGVRIRSILMNRPRRFARNTIAYYEAVREESSRRDSHILGFDYLLLSHPCEIHEEIHGIKIITDAKILNVGYTKGMPAWRKYLDQAALNYLKEGLNVPYFFFPLSAVGLGFISGENSISMAEKLRESLLVLKEYNAKILTVFKPHFKTDMDEFYRILNEVGYRNYTVSYLHPDILCRGAKFTFSYHSTSVFIDSYFIGCPTVEYAHYDTRFLELNKQRPRYLDAIDYFSHRDPVKLHKILNSVLSEQATIVRDHQKLSDDFFTLYPAEIEQVFSFLR